MISGARNSRSVSSHVETAVIQELPAVVGTYALVLHLKRARSIQIGQLGSSRFGVGWYVYVGSAFGSGGLRARLRRHIESRHRPVHWHIDHVRRHMRVTQVWWSTDRDRLECAWADVLTELPGASIPMRRFGASDCRCSSHLVHFDSAPTLDMLKQVSRLFRTAQPMAFEKHI